MAVETETEDSNRPQALDYLRIVVYTLGVLLGLSLLIVGTVAIIAQIKGTWHWMIHLESTVSYMSIFISWVLTALVPLFCLLFVGRWWWSDG